MKTKNVAIFSLIGFIIISLVAGGIFFNNFQKEQEAKYKFEEARANFMAVKLHQRDSLVNDYVNTLNEIEKDLLYIKEQENLLDAQSNDPELAKDKKGKIINDIQLVYSLVEQNKKKIAELSKKLKNSGVEIAALNEKVKYLTTTIEDRDNSIIALNQQLTQKDNEIINLGDQVGTLETVVIRQKGLLDEQETSLNTAYIAAGNFKDLKERGILTKEGGFLGIAKYKSLANEIPEESFTKIDVTETKSYPVFSERVELITEHPAGSYQWVEENNQIAYMVISDPKEFWKISKYAVLETK